MAQHIPHWRHVFRSLLRECSYLPDPIACEYMHGYVYSGYRAHLPKSSRVRITTAEQARLERRSRKLLSLLHRANQGYIKPLERVLWMSYGRIGKRRRQLMETITAPPIPPDRKAVQALSPHAKFSDDWAPSSILMSLLKDQARRPNQLPKIRPSVKALDPSIPEVNIWGRPFPMKRRINLRRKWYKSILDSVLPPLPEQDWDILRGLVTGAQPWIAPKRRSRLEESNTQSNVLDAKFLVHGPEKGHTFEEFARGRPHVITRRFMRHLWEGVCASTPRMTWDATGTSWKIEWGTPQPPAPIFQKLDPNKGLELFDGVDVMTGKIPLPLRR